MKNLVIIIFWSFVIPFNAVAAADHYESSGKLYAVIACVAVIIIGIGLFLFYLERRISSMEKMLED